MAQTWVPSKAHGEFQKGLKISGHPAMYSYLLEENAPAPFFDCGAGHIFCVFLLQVSEDFWNHFHSDLTATPAEEDQL